MTSDYIKALQEKDRQIVEDLCSYLRAYHATEVAIRRAIDDVADTYDLSSNQVIRTFFAVKHMTPQQWILYFLQLKKLGVDVDDSRHIQPERIAEELDTLPLSTSRALVVAGPVRDVPRYDIPVIRTKSSWEKFEELVKEAKNATGPLHHIGS